MKAFICGAVTLTLLIGAVIANGILIIKKTDALLFEIENLSDDIEDADSSLLLDKWESSRTWIALTVHRETVDDIDDTLAKMETYIKTGNEEAYLVSRTYLKCLTERLQKTESFSVSRIF